MLAHGFENVIVLSDEFFQEVMAHPIPTDLEAVRLLASAPAILDLFVWLSYRCFTAKSKESIPIFGVFGLVHQIGPAEYVRPRRFREKLDHGEPVMGEFQNQAAIASDAQASVEPDALMHEAERQMLATLLTEQEQKELRTEYARVVRCGRVPTARLAELLQAIPKVSLLHDVILNRCFC